MTTENPTVQTSRLELRPLQAGDAEVLHRIYQAEGVLQYFPNPHPPSLEKVQRFISGQQAHWQLHGYGNWGVRLIGQEDIMGWAGLQWVPELDETEVGYLLDSRFWGQGYATEAAAASLGYGFERFKLDHIIALVHPQNNTSIRVTEKCGMVYQDTRLLWGIELRRYRIERIRWGSNRP